MLVVIIIGFLRVLNNVFLNANTSLLGIPAYCGSLSVKLRTLATTTASARLRRSLF